MHARQRLAPSGSDGRTYACLALVLLGFASSARAAPAKVDFARDIRPILSQHCAACHGFDEKTRKAKLRLDVRESAIARKAIVPGDVEASSLVARVESADEAERMPPRSFKKPLSAEQKRLLRAWVAQGASYSRHWAFAAPIRPVPPKSDNTRWGRNAIDAFILERLRRERLQPSPEADKPTLIRRVTLDLTGLPPTTAELDAFEADVSPDAYEKVVARLLASSQYAERMALAWLDAARYADTNGFNNDEDRTQWPWRDWVIDAFRRNMPYDRFVLEQVAGDMLPGATRNQKVATAFHRNQVHNTEGGIIPEEYRVEYVADRVHTSATVFLGLSMQCARCHDHKFDPISQKEYYQFFAFFNNVSDKPASYSNFVAAEPFLRIPSRKQQDAIDQLEVRRASLMGRVKQLEARADAATIRWDKVLTLEEKQKLAASGLLLRLPLNETKGDAVADGDGKRRGTVLGKPAWGPGKLGGALAFDGKSHVVIDDGPAFDGATAFSIGLWLNSNSKGTGALVSKMDDLAAHRGYDVLLEEGKVAVHLVHHWLDNAIKVTTTKAVTPNAWHQLLVTYDGSRKAAGVRVYIDGKLEASSATRDDLRGTIRTAKPLHLGKRQTTIPFEGTLDEVQFFGVELTAEDATELAAGRAVNLAVGLLGIPAEKRTAAQHSRVRRYYLDRIDKDYAKLQTDLAVVVRRVAEMEKSLPALMVMQELPKVRETFLLNRGDYDKPGDKVTAGVPVVLPPLPAGAADRLALARWLVDPSNPLTARVAVNRWWQMIFGIGLVKTVEDFGVTGELLPSRAMSACGISTRASSSIASPGRTARVVPAPSRTTASMSWRAAPAFPSASGS